MPICRFIVHGNRECVETGTVAEISTLTHPVTLNTLIDLVPFEGVFHFRHKGNLEGTDVWIDIMDNNMVLNPSRGGDVLDIQVSFPSDALIVLF